MRLNRRRLRAFARQLPNHIRQLPAQLAARRPTLASAIILSIGLLTLTIWTVTRLATTKLPTPAPTVVTHSTDKPTEDQPNPAKYHWTGQSIMPKYLKLPSIKAEGFVQQVGVDQHKAIAVPTNIHVAGWFVNSQRPGTQGLSIIDGHLDGRTSGGIFEHLAKLKPGNTFTVTYGNDSTKTFVVRRVQSAPTAETASLLFSQDPNITHQLNLITCGGTYDKSRKQYDERVVVMAELVRKS